MKNLKYLIVFTAITVFMTANSFARKPAVEPMVGVETESYIETTDQTIFAFDFRQETSATSVSTWVSGVVIGAFALLPFLMWFGITRQAQDYAKAMEELETVSPQSHSNVANLADYKRDESVNEESDFDQDENKKAS